MNRIVILSFLLVAARLGYCAYRASAKTDKISCSICAAGLVMACLSLAIWDAMTRFFNDGDNVLLLTVLNNVLFGVGFSLMAFGHIVHVWKTKFLKSALVGFAFFILAVGLQGTHGWTRHLLPFIIGFGAIVFMPSLLYWRRDKKLAESYRTL